MSILNLARKELVDRIGYKTADPSRGHIRLHANESPWCPDEREYNRYPQPRNQALTTCLANLYQMAPEQILPTRGSDDGIDLLIRGFCRAGSDSITVCPPTFGMYSAFAEIQDASVLEAPLIGETFDLPVEDLLTTTSKLLFVCSPNNPTGNRIKNSVLEQLAKKLQQRAILVVDEAYVEFSDTDSCKQLVGKFANVVVLRTLSKAYGLAGVRCGAVIAHPEVIQLLNSIMAPYAIPSPCVDVVLSCLDNLDQTLFDRQRLCIAEEKSRLQQLFRECPQVERSWPSETNFLLVRFADAKQAFQALLDNGVLVRDFSTKPRLENCLRITVGSPDQNALVKKTLSELS